MAGPFRAIKSNQEQSMLLKDNKKPFKAIATRYELQHKFCIRKAGNLIKH